MTHPCFTFGTPEFIRDEKENRKAIVLLGYFQKRENQIDEWFFETAPNALSEDLKMYKVHGFNYQLSEYLNTFVKSGFFLEEVVELIPNHEILEKDPGFSAECIVVNLLLFRH